MGTTQSQENTYKQNQTQLNSLLVPKTNLDKAVNALNIVGGICLFVIIVLFFYANKINNTNNSKSKNRAFDISVIIFGCILLINAFILWILNLVKNQKNSKTKLSNANLGLKIVKNILSAVVILLCIFKLAPKLDIQLGRYNFNKFSNIIFKIISAGLSMLLFLIPGLFVLWNLNKKVKLQIINKIRCDENINIIKEKTGKNSFNLTKISKKNLIEKKIIPGNTKKSKNIQNLVLNIKNNCENYRTYIPFNLYLAVQNVKEYNQKIIDWLKTKNSNKNYQKNIESLLNNKLTINKIPKINTNEQILKTFIKEFFEKKNDPEARQEIVNSILNNCPPLDTFSIFDGSFLLKNFGFFFAMATVFSLNSKQIDTSVTRNSVSIVFLLIPIIYAVVNEYRLKKSRMYTIERI